MLKPPVLQKTVKKSLHSLIYLPWSVWNRWRHILSCPYVESRWYVELFQQLEAQAFTKWMILQCKFRACLPDMNTDKRSNRQMPTWKSYEICTLLQRVCGCDDGRRRRWRRWPWRPLPFSSSFAARLSPIDILQTGKERSQQDYSVWLMVIGYMSAALWIYVQCTCVHTTCIVSPSDDDKDRSSNWVNNEEKRKKNEPNNQLK